MAGASCATAPATARRWSRDHMARWNGPGYGPALAPGKKVWRAHAPAAGVRCGAVRSGLVRPSRSGVLTTATALATVAGGSGDSLADRVGEARRPRALAGDDIGRRLDDLEGRRIRRPRGRAGVDVRLPPVPRGAVAEDVDAQGQRRRLVETVGSEADRGGVEGGVVAARIARRPAGHVDPESAELSGDARERLRVRDRRRLEDARAAGQA